MRTKVKLFFDELTGKLNRAVIPEFHEHDDVLIIHQSNFNEIAVEMPLDVYRSFSINDYQPDPYKLEAYFARNRQ